MSRIPNTIDPPPSAPPLPTSLSRIPLPPLHRAVTMPEILAQRSSGGKGTEQELVDNAAAEEILTGEPAAISVSLFDYSVENHLEAMETIAKLCSRTQGDQLNQNDAKRFSNSITFLTDWSHCNYDPRIVQFSSQVDCNPEENDVFGGINLPRFSSAAVPKRSDLYGGMASPGCNSKDFVMYVGGSVWAMDWCPRVDEKPDLDMTCEFLAIGAHPPESYYHKMGEPLVGKGIIQIWSILNTCGDDDVVSPVNNAKKQKSESSKMKEKKTRGRPRKDASGISLQTSVKKPRGRPRKEKLDASENKTGGRPKSTNYDDSSIEMNEAEGIVQALDVQHPDDSVMPLLVVSPLEDAAANPKLENRDKNETLCEVALSTKLPVRRKRMESGYFKNTVLTNNGLETGSLDARAKPSSVLKDITLPRVVACLGHDGKVAWDLKWRPTYADESKSMGRMGYLAVLLGNGSLEVWEVPMPFVMKSAYLSLTKEGIDPRFLKLKPVFRCSNLKCGDIQSIPLTLEWSTLAKPNFLLAGYHDGTVAIWKFSTKNLSEDTRPLLRFSADTVPIRAVAWAPVKSDTEGANVIATAGHGGLRFWDIRDPFRPLWDLHPVPRFIYGMDWLSEPRCVILSFDDGTMRILSLQKAAYDVPVTGRSYSGTKQQGLSTYNCSSFAIWSVQASRKMGVVAYCCADGNVLHFQLTANAVEKDARYRSPHFLSGKVTEENSTFTVHTPKPDSPISLRSANENGETPRCLRNFLTGSPQSNKVLANQSKVMVSSDKPLALCYEEGGGRESLSDEDSPEGSKLKAKIIEDGGEATSVDEEADKGKSCNERESFAQKLAAMHIVRWNMNKGSERWLCSGGAAGIVRCQEIMVSESGKKSSRRSGSRCLSLQKCTK